MAKWDNVIEVVNIHFFSASFFLLQAEWNIMEDIHFLCKNMLSNDQFFLFYFML